MLNPELNIHPAFERGFSVCNPIPTPPGEPCHIVLVTSTGNQSNERERQSLIPTRQSIITPLKRDRVDGNLARGVTWRNVASQLTGNIDMTTYYYYLTLGDSEVAMLRMGLKLTIEHCEQKIEDGEVGPWTAHKSSAEDVLSRLSAYTRLMSGNDFSEGEIQSGLEIRVKRSSGANHPLEHNPNLGV